MDIVHMGFTNLISDLVGSRKKKKRPPEIGMSQSTFLKLSLTKSRPIVGLFPTFVQQTGDDKAFHIVPHKVPSVCSLDKYCCR